MSYEDLMARIAREIPELAGKLSAPRVTYVRSLQKTYITFDSSVLAGEKEFLALEKILKELFPARRLALRISSRNCAALSWRTLRNTGRYWTISCAGTTRLPRDGSDGLIGRLNGTSSGGMCLRKGTKRF